MVSDSLIPCCIFFYVRLFLFIRFVLYFSSDLRIDRAAAGGSSEWAGATEHPTFSSKPMASGSDCQ
jgi:hypothetical protein